MKHWFRWLRPRWWRKPKTYHLGTRIQPVFGPEGSDAVFTADNPEKCVVGSSPRPGVALSDVMTEKLKK